MAPWLFVLPVFLLTTSLGAASCPVACTCHTPRLRAVAECGGAGLTRIPMGIPEATTAFYASHNNLTFLDNNTFSTLQLVHLERLTLNYNLLSDIDLGAFRDLPALKWLGLAGNRLTSLHPDTFRSLPALLSLDLSANPLQLPTSGVFLNVPTLHFLSLDNSNIRHMSPEVFRGTPELLLVRLQGNRLTEVHSALGWDELHHLMLQDNLLSSVYLESSNLTRLNLSGNALGRSMATLSISAPHLQQLELSACGLTALPPTLANTPEVNTLNMAHNQLHNLDAALMRALPRLNELHINHNHLQELPPDILQGNSNLTLLDLSNNALQLTTGVAFLNIPSLRTLVLSSCGLNLITQQTLQGVANISKLVLHDNQLQALDKAVFNLLPRLEVLDVSENQVRLLEADTFSENMRLVRLDLSRNPLLMLIGEPFLESSTLQFLTLRSCGLHTIPDTAFQTLPVLTNLDLSSNRLTTLQDTPFRGVRALRALFLAGNPWSCNCTLRPLWNWCTENDCISEEPVRCSQPSRKDWSLVEDLVCQDVEPGSDEFDVNMEVEIVEITPSRGPPTKIRAQA